MLSGSWARYAPLAGLLFVALVVASIIVGGETPETDDATAKVVAEWARDDSEQIASALISALAAIPFLWFLGSLRSTLRAGEGGTGRLSAIAYGAGIVVVAGAAIDASLQFAVADSVGEVPPNVTQTLSVLYSDFFLIFPVGFVPLFIASALVILRTRVLPAWLGWTALVLGILGLAGPVGFFAFLVGLLWIAAASIVMFQQGNAAPPAPGQTALPTTPT
jgi:hypothetical protein